MPIDLIIDDTTPHDILYPAGFGQGLVPRDFSAQPVRAVQMDTIPRSEWSARIKEQIERKSRLSDVWRTGDAGKPIKHLDQAQSNYCWAHASVHAVYAVRAVNNQPFVNLSAYGVAATIMKGRNDGGWSALALQFIGEKGVPPQSRWPQGSFNLGYGTPDCWNDAAGFKAGETWVDVAAPYYDRDLSFDQVATCLLLGEPVPVDLLWWGHAVCALDLVEVEANSFGIRIVNSWLGWGDDMGMAVLRGKQAIPDNAVSLRTVTASAA